MIGGPDSFPQPSGWSLWVRWALAHASLGALCLVLPCGFFALVGVGAIVQWLLLRPYVRAAGDWPLLTEGGMLVGCPALVWAFFDPANRSIGHNALLFALFTAVVGLAQGYTLRARRGEAALWVVASAAGGALFWLAYDGVWNLANAAYTDYPYRWIVARHVYFNSFGYGEPSAASLVTWLCQGAAGGLAYGAATGAALLWLQRAAQPPVARDLQAADGPLARS
jgi:hypothetical protein